MTKVGIKFGLSDLYHNFFPTNDWFVIGWKGMYYTFAKQNRMIKYDQLLSFQRSSILCSEKCPKYLVNKHIQFDWIIKTNILFVHILFSFFFIYLHFILEQIREALGCQSWRLTGFVLAPPSGYGTAGWMESHAHGCTLRHWWQCWQQCYYI